VAKAVKIKSPTKRARDEARRQAQASRRRRNRLMLVAGVLAVAAVVALIIVGAISRGGGGGSTATVANKEGKTLGLATAPVTLTAWEDFQCPFCKQANAGPIQQVINDYVNTGKVKIEYKQFPFLGNGGAKDESVLAAEASECANDQGSFWPYHDALFDAQAGENRGAFSAANLKKIAANVGLDQEAFASCLDSGKYRSAVLAEKAQGDKLGITSTPTFFVNGQRILGNQPYSVFKDAIEKALQAAQ
jgi:protein-disulfide isomerase